MRKTLKGLCLLLSILVLVASCGKKEAPVADLGDKYLSEAEYLNAIIGLNDMYVIEFAQNVDYMHGISYDDSVIKSITVTADAVDTNVADEYKVVFTIEPVNGEAFSVERTVTVVDEEKAKELAESGVVVLSGDGGVWESEGEAGGISLSNLDISVSGVRFEGGEEYTSMNEGSTGMMFIEGEVKSPDVYSVMIGIYEFHPLSQGEINDAINTHIPIWKEEGYVFTSNLFDGQFGVGFPMFVEYEGKLAYVLLIGTDANGDYSGHCVVEVRC